jgi:addiction module RelB/DinJ family antitoxin
MKTVVINIKTDKKTKDQAKKLAEELGLNLSSVINGCLRSFVIKRKITFDANPAEEPSEFLLNALAEAMSEKEHSPVFDNSRDAISWLKDENKKYESGIQKKIRKSVRQGAGKGKKKGI